MPGRALVLGGGGITGIAWELGVLAGMAEAGIDLTTADFVVGTSAGSVVATLVTADDIDLGTAFRTQVDEPVTEAAARLPTPVMLRLGWAMVRARDPRKARVRIGRVALHAHTGSSAREWRDSIAAQLPVGSWPDRDLLITSVDAETGELVVLTKDSGVPLADAVAASCAVPGVWPPVPINGRLCMDGGMRSATNLDLASDYPRIVVIAPMVAGGGPIPSVSDQVAELGERAKVTVIAPDVAARQAIGRNVLDPARRAPAAQAGRAQAATAYDAVSDVWSSAAYD